MFLNSLQEINYILLNPFQDLFDVQLDVFDKHALHFLESMKRCVGDECMTSKMHGFSHVILDLRKFRTQLHASSTYCFETSIQRFRAWLRSGHKPLEQIRSVPPSKSMELHIGHYLINCFLFIAFYSDSQESIV